jgi:protein TonB
MAIAEDYPAGSRRAEEEGDVIIQACVEADGRISSTSLRRSSGYERLDKAALKLVKKVKATPAKDMSGAPVRYCDWTPLFAFRIH